MDQAEEEAAGEEEGIGAGAVPDMAETITGDQAIHGETITDGVIIGVLTVGIKIATEDTDL